MESATENKAELRKKQLVTRRAMTMERWISDSEKIQARAASLPLLREAARVHCYVSMEHDREVRTLELLEKLSLDGKEVYMPYIEEGVMRAAVYHPGQRFRVSPRLRLLQSRSCCRKMSASTWSLCLSRGSIVRADASVLEKVGMTAFSAVFWPAASDR